MVPSNASPTGKPVGATALYSRWALELGPDPVAAWTLGTPSTSQLIDDLQSPASSARVRRRPGSCVPARQAWVVHRDQQAIPIEIRADPNTLVDPTARMQHRVRDELAGYQRPIRQTWAEPGDVTERATHDAGSVAITRQVQGQELD